MKCGNLRQIWGDGTRFSSWEIETGHYQSLFSRRTLQQWNTYFGRIVKSWSLKVFKIQPNKSTAGLIYSWWQSGFEWEVGLNVFSSYVVFCDSAVLVSTEQPEESQVSLPVTCLGLSGFPYLEVSWKFHSVQTGHLWLWLWIKDGFAMAFTEPFQSPGTVESCIIRDGCCISLGESLV